MTKPPEEKARASPKRLDKTLRLNQRFIRLEEGGERIVIWDLIEIVDQEPINTSAEKIPEEPPQVRPSRRMRRVGQVSTMLILQVATLIVAVIAVFLTA